MDGAERGHHPDPLFGANGHHAAGGEDQLVFGMVMLGDDMAVIEVDGDAGHMGQQTPISPRKNTVALLRHYLSQYRENETRSSAISCRAGTLED